MATAKKASTSATAKRTVASKPPAPAKKAAAKRTLVEPTPGDKRYVRRDDGGRFDEVDDVSASLAQDVRTAAKAKAKPGQGDTGDRAPARGAGAKRAVAKKRVAVAKKALAKTAPAKKAPAGKATARKATAKKGS